ncbi:hypothetical protein [Egicoccus sp. AB-alg6-2]|uniref:hypothetical protein n=1 Tax=Egicoccus sp. AB-alg6-2 TaxID=3242692 RepID=UPI00359E16B1
MTGSWIARSLLLVPVLLAGVGVGMVVAGLTADPAAGGRAAAAVILLGALRALRTGVQIDTRRERVRVRTFWRTYRLPLDALQRVDAGGRTDAGTPAVRFLLRDGREYGSTSLAYLAGHGADQFVGDLRDALEGRGVEISLTAASFRRAA